jgi:hypothetical protein
MSGLANAARHGSISSGAPLSDAVVVKRAPSTRSGSGSSGASGSSSRARNQSIPHVTRKYSATPHSTTATAIFRAVIGPPVSPAFATTVTRKPSGAQPKAAPAR